jgi:hypothetical protein
MEPTECSETSAFNIQTPGKYPEENIPQICLRFSSPIFTQQSFFDLININNINCRVDIVELEWSKISDFGP